MLNVKKLISFPYRNVLVTYVAILAFYIHENHFIRSEYVMRDDPIYNTTDELIGLNFGGNTRRLYISYIGM